MANSDPVYSDMKPEQFASAIMLLSERPISYEYDSDNPTWIRLHDPSTADVEAFEAALRGQ